MINYKLNVLNRAGHIFIVNYIVTVTIITIIINVLIVIMIMITVTVIMATIIIIIIPKEIRLYLTAKLSP